MTTLLEVLNKAKKFLSEKGVPSAQADAEWLFAHVLNCKRLDLFLQYDKILNEATLEQLRSFVKRRASREPLQQIIGFCEFHGLKLKTDSRALIPRPETEELIDYLLQLKESPMKILDLGTGTGAIALSLAKALPESHVVAVDQSIDALSLAQENAKNNAITNVEFLESNWFEKVNGQFDWIVSNPPYLTEDEWISAEPEVQEHDPKSALVAPQDGAADLLHILQYAPKFLTQNGILALEMGIHHTDVLSEAARPLYASYKVINDLSSRPRFFIANK